MKKSKGKQNPKNLFSLVSICFIFSGASSLILEVTWSKYLSLLLGSTIYGVSTVVAAFMAGLGLGSLVAGSVSSRLRNHIRAYGWLEGIVGVFALLSPLLFTHIDVLFVVLYNLSSQSFALFLFIRFIILFILLMIPTLAMGASLPILVEYFAKREPESKGHIGFFYAVNTVGAVLGTAIAGFWLIPQIGLARTSITAAVIDCAIFGLLFVLRFPAVSPEVAARKAFIQKEGEKEKAPEETLEGRKILWKGVAIAILFGISGLLAMVYQVGWTRILIIYLGSSVYCFAIILILYLAGLSIGAGATARIAEKTSYPLAWFGLLEALIAATTYLGSFWFGELPSLTAWAFRSSGGKPFVFFLCEALIAAPIVLPPTLAMGAIFPFAARAFRDVIGKAGRAVGIIYAANTIGTIIGSLGVGFVLIPLLGARSTILAAAAVSAAVGIIIIAIASEGRPMRIASAALAFLAAGGAIMYPPVVRLIDANYGLVSILRQERAMMASQAQSTSGAERDLSSAFPLPVAEGVIFYREGLNAMVAVGAGESDRFLFINGKGDASTTKKDMVTQSMLGHLGMFFYPDASDVLVIGLGSGVTTHAVLTYPSVRRVDTIEIESAVADATEYFRDVNHDALKDPRHHLFLEDARTWLSYSGRTYDVIISEPSNPWIAGINNLFTREFYRKVSQKLHPGGIFCQWIQTYEIGEESAYTILRTLSKVFSDSHVFYATEFGDLLVIARKPPLRRPSPERAFAIPAVAEDVAEIGIGSPAILGLFYKTSVDHLLAKHPGAIINTDDNGYLEHRAPFDLIDPKISSFPFVVKNAYFEDYHSLFYPEKPAGQVLAEAGIAAARQGDVNFALWALNVSQDRGYHEAVAALRPEVENARRKEEMNNQCMDHIRKADELQAGGKFKEAIEELKKAGALDPRDNRALSKAALLLMDLDQQKLAEMMFRQLIRRGDRTYLYMAHVNLGVLLGRRQANAEGLDEFKKAISMNPYLGTAYYFGSYALEALGKQEEAIAFLRSSLRYSSEDPAILNRLAELLDKNGKSGEARHFRRLAKKYES